MMFRSSMSRVISLMSISSLSVSFKTWSKIAVKNKDVKIILNQSGNEDCNNTGEVIATEMLFNLNNLDLIILI